MKTIELASEGIKLKANLFYPEKLQEKNPAILFVHGWTSNQTRDIQNVKALGELGYICFTFDMRGHGEDKTDLKSLSRTNFLNDALAAYDYLAKLPDVDPENISVIGSSFGSYTSVILTGKRAVKNLVLRVPANYNDEDFEFPWTNKRFDENGSIAHKALHNFKGNVLIIESEKDEKVGQQTIENYKKAVKDQSLLSHVVMRGALHSIKQDPVKVKEYTNILVDWFGKITQ